MELAGVFAFSRGPEIPFRYPENTFRKRQVTPWERARGSGQAADCSRAGFNSPRSSVPERRLNHDSSR
jgi:hypothetical protein